MHPNWRVFILVCMLALVVGTSDAGADPLPAPIVLDCLVVAQGPVIDGDGSDAVWEAASPQRILLREAKGPGHGPATEAEVSAVRTADTIYFRVTWADTTHDATHKTWVWNAETSAYAAGPDREDVLALAFPIAGPFTGNMRSPTEATWDVWQWKAARTDPAGYAMDKRHVFTAARPEGKAKSFETRTGGEIWIARPEDGGTSPQGRQAAPDAYATDRVAQYVPQAPAGSAADVRAKGRWHAGHWTVELARVLSTGHGDDVDFGSLRPVPFGLAVFDREEHEDHSTSGQLELRFGNAGAVSAG